MFVTRASTYYEGFAGLGEDATFSLNVPTPGYGTGRYSFNDTGYYTIPGNSSILLVIDPAGYVGFYVGSFTMLVKGFRNAQQLMFYYSVIDRATGNVLLPKKRIYINNSFTQAQFAPGKAGPGKKDLPWDINTVKYIYTVTNGMEDSADVEIAWWPENVEQVIMQIPAEQISILPAPVSVAVPTYYTQPFGPFEETPVPLQTSMPLTSLLPITDVSGMLSQLFTPAQTLLPAEQAATTPSVMTAGFDFGGSWPILAIIAIGAFVAFKKPSRAGGRRRKRTRK